MRTAIWNFLSIEISKRLICCTNSTHTSKLACSKLAARTSDSHHNLESRPNLEDESTFQNSDYNVAAALRPILSGDASAVSSAKRDIQNTQWSGKRFKKIRNDLQCRSCIFFACNAFDALLAFNRERPSRLICSFGSPHHGCGIQSNVGPDCTILRRTRRENAPNPPLRNPPQRSRKGRQAIFIVLVRQRAENGSPAREKSPIFNLLYKCKFFLNFQLKIYFCSNELASLEIPITIPVRLTAASRRVITCWDEARDKRARPKWHVHFKKHKMPKCWQRFRCAGL